jgi:hypothetical protein
MKNSAISEEKLNEIRRTLPRGSKKELRIKHNISACDVYRILTGKGVRSGKCNPENVIKDAILIYNDIISARRENEKLLKASEENNSK